MVKSAKLEQLNTPLKKLEDLVDNRELQLGEVVDAKTTESHDEIVALQTRLQHVIDKLGAREAEVASEVVTELGSDLAERIGDTSQLEKLLALSKSGELAKLLGKTDDESADESKNSAEAVSQTATATVPNHDDNLSHDDGNRSQNASAFHAHKHG